MDYFFYRGGGRTLLLRDGSDAVSVLREGWFVVNRQFFEADKFSNAPPTKFVPIRSTCASAK